MGLAILSPKPRKNLSLQRARRVRRLDGQIPAQKVEQPAEHWTDPKRPKTTKPQTLQGSLP